MSNSIPVMVSPLPLFVKEVLHEGHFSDIEPETAKLIMALANWKDYCHIQLVDREGEALKYPRLWQIGAWRQDTESWRISKMYADKRRIESFLFQANTIIIKTRLLKTWLVTPEHAEMLAVRWLRDGERGMAKIASLNVTLKTKEEEL